MGNFICHMQRNLAQRSVGPSTVRRMGPKGTVASARNFLQQYDLGKLRDVSEEEFLIILNEATLELKSALPEGARNWGTARKLINIFFRGALYNRYLCEHFGLQKLEPWLEIPLDSHVAKGLKQKQKRIPRWMSVISLTPEESALYQAAASEISREENLARVHLDLIYWRGDHLDKK